MAKTHRDSKVTRKFKAELPVKLTDEELLDRGKALADIEQKIRDEADHAENVKKELKSREARLVLERSRLAGIVRDRAEPRPVDCHAILRFTEGIYEEVREDTGEVLAMTQRPLTNEERQLGFKLNPAPTAENLFKKEKNDGESEEQEGGAA